MNTYNICDRIETSSLKIPKYKRCFQNNCCQLKRNKRESVWLRTAVCYESSPVGGAPLRMPSSFTPVHGVDAVNISLTTN